MASFRKQIIRSASRYAENHGGSSEHERPNDVVITGVLLNAENPREQPFGAYLMMRKYCVLIDEHTSKRLVEKWGPGVPVGQHPKPTMVQFEESEYEGEPPNAALVGFFSKKSQEEIVSKLTKQGLDPASFGVVPSVCSLAKGGTCKIEIEASFYDDLDASKVRPGDLVKVIGIRYYCSYRFMAEPKAGKSQHQRYVNMCARSISTIARLSPDDLMQWYSSQGLVSSFLPKYETSLVQADYNGPHFTVSVHVNKRNPEKGSIEELWPPMMSGMENGLLVTQRSVNTETDYNSILIRPVNDERKEALVWSIKQPAKGGHDQATRNMLALLGGELTYSVDGLSHNDPPADSLTLAMYGRFSISVPDPSDSNKTLGKDTITFTQPGMKGTIYMPLESQYHTKVVKPLGVVDFRIYPSELAPLGVQSLDTWLGLTGYVPSLECIISGPVMGDLSEKLDVNQGGCIIPTDESVLRPAAAEEYISWDDPDEEGDKAEPMQEDDQGSEKTRKVAFPAVCGYSITVKRFLVDGRAFYSKGIPISKETCLRIFEVSNERLQKRCDDLATLLAVKPQVKAGEQVNRFMAAKQTTPEQRIEEQVSELAFYHTDYIQNRILRTYNLVVVNEGCLPIDEDKMNDVEMLLKNDKAHKRVACMTILPVLQAGMQAYDGLFEKFQQLSTEEGDALCSYLDPETFGTDRETLRTTWVSNGMDRLVELVEELGSDEDCPRETPITAIVCHPNVAWKSKTAAESFYGPFIVPDIPTITPSSTTTTDKGKEKTVDPPPSGKEKSDPPSPTKVPAPKRKSRSRGGATKKRKKASAK